MSDLEKRRTQRDAQRAVARRVGGSTPPEQAILRYLSVELYKNRPRPEPPQEASGRADGDSPNGPTEHLLQRAVH
ncbi:hypothetical protein OHA10_32855 [Kribbella sp. NBC_00662]|uniref:hypothetical protein n=1 Tax=Kribbella sp. NBC_00662 TaxID=2975969 RepID=UPI00324CEABF